MWIAARLLGVYFSLGTETAYGKMGALPITAFFIYVYWLIFVLGAEVSFLVQNRAVFTGKRINYASLAEAMVLRQVLERVETQHHTGTPLLGINEIAQSLDVSHFVVQKAVSFLMDQKILTEVHEDQHDFNGELKVLLTRALKEGEEVMIIQGFLGVHKLVQSFDASPIFREIFAPLSKK